MGISDELIQTLNDSGIDAVDAEHSKCGYHISVSPLKDQLRTFAGIMLDTEFYLDFVTAVHVESGLQVVYQFGHFTEGCHVNAKLFTDSGSVPTISDIFQGANWHERETKDFYGLLFDDHPDLRVLILDEDDFDLKPLLKDEKKLKALEDITRKSVSEDKAASAEKEDQKPGV